MSCYSYPSILGPMSWRMLAPNLPIYYHAPMDFRPRKVTIARVYKNGKIRIAKPSADSDPFTADAAHLDRFRYLACDSIRYVGQPRFVNVPANETEDK